MTTQDTTPQDQEMGKRIRAARLDAGLKQEELAERIGVSRFTLGQMETGRRPVKATELKDISRVLRVPIAQLLDAPEPEMAPHVTINVAHVVSCASCGIVGAVPDRRRATRMRSTHLGECKR